MNQIRNYSPSKIRGAAFLLLIPCIILGLMTVHAPASDLTPHGPQGLALLNCVYANIAMLLAGIVILRDRDIRYETLLVVGLILCLGAGQCYYEPKIDTELWQAINHPLFTIESLLLISGFVLIALAHMVAVKVDRKEEAALLFLDVASLFGMKRQPALVPVPKD